MNDIEFGDLSFIHLWIDVLLVTTKEKWKGKLAEFSYWILWSKKKKKKQANAVLL